MSSRAASSAPAASDDGSDQNGSPRLRVVAQPPGAARLAALEAEITTLAGHLAAATARFLCLLAEFDKSEGWQAHGLRSCAQWLSWKCGMSITAAREHVRVAQALPGLPKAREAFEAGRLSFSKVRALTRVASPETEAELVETAQSCTASQLDRICSGIKHVRDADEVVSHRSQAKFTATWRADAMLAFSGRLAPEDGATLLAALAALRSDPIRREHNPSVGTRASVASGGGDEPAPADSRHGVESATDAPAPNDRLPDDEFRDRGMLAARADAEALVMLARHGLDTPPGAVLGGPVRLIVHTTAEPATAGGSTPAPAPANPPERGSAAGPSAPGDTPAGVSASTPCLDAGPGIPLLPLSPTTLERLACGAIVESATDPDSSAEGASRNRFASRRQRRALLRRDGGCRFAGCPRRRGLHAHHVVHFARGGPTTMDNVILLCDHHHLLVHEGGWRLERSTPGWVAVSPTGERHESAPRTSGQATQLPRAHPAAIRPGTVTGRWSGERLDLPYVVGTLVQRPTST